MRIKMGFVTGLAVGYYLGAMAGRQRYEQLNRLIGKISHSAPVDMAADRAKSAADAGFHRAKDKVSHRMHHNGTAERSSFPTS